MRRAIAPLILLLLLGCTATPPSDSRSPVNASATAQPTDTKQFPPRSDRPNSPSIDSSGSSTNKQPLTPTQAALGEAASSFTVVSVGDGDTLRVRMGSQTKTIRLACVDAPERDQLGGTAATQRLEELLPPGTGVQLRPVDTDRYGRTVAEVYRDSRSINLQLVAEGMVVVYPDYLDGCASNRTQYLQAEQQAKQQRLGFWQQSNPQMPWEWRQANRQNSTHTPIEPTSQPSPTAQGLPNCVNSDCDCKDFQTQAEAQRVFEAFPDDRFRLDRDGDRRVCEALP